GRDRLSARALGIPCSAGHHRESGVSRLRRYGDGCAGDLACRRRNRRDLRGVPRAAAWRGPAQTNYSAGGGGGPRAVSYLTRRVRHHRADLQHLRRPDDGLAFVKRVAPPRDSADLHADAVRVLDVEAYVVRRIAGAALLQARLQAAAFELGFHAVGVPIVNGERDVIEPPGRGVRRAGIDPNERTRPRADAMRLAILEL